MKTLLTGCILLIASALSAQHGYRDSLNQYLHDYVVNHEVVKGADKKLIAFYDGDENYRVAAKVHRKENSPWFKMETSGVIKKIYRVYGLATFILNDTLQKLNIYQSQSLMHTSEYKDHLFIPFTDATSGFETYIGGRYYDFSINDIHIGQLVIDFNKAYNPYCAYVTGVYNCPVPPKENQLTVAIKAGEKSFAKDQ